MSRGKYLEVKFYEKMKQADALYHLGDFEHALVFYHRGLRWVHTPGDQVTRWVQVTQVGPGDSGGSRWPSLCWVENHLSL